MRRRLALEGYAPDFAPVPAGSAVAATTERSPPSRHSTRHGSDGAPSYHRMSFAG